MISEEQLDQRLAATLDLVGMGLYFHIGFNLADTGSLGDARAFDLDRAHTTDRHRWKPRIVAEHRDGDPQRAGCVPDGRACGHGDRAAVDGQRQRLSVLCMHVGHDWRPCSRSPLPQGGRGSTG